MKALPVLVHSAHYLENCEFHSFPIVRLRLRSVKNIQKITKSMKMVSAAKFARAERELKPARVYGSGASGKQILFQQ